MHNEDFYRGRFVGSDYMSRKLLFISYQCTHSQSLERFGVGHSPQDQKPGGFAARVSCSVPPSPIFEGCVAKVRLLEQCGFRCRFLKCGNVLLGRPL